jgi:predicted transcriptional regulator
MDEVAKYLKALLVLQLEALKNSESESKPEVLLSRAGLSHKEIADLIGKTQAAVAKAISRSRISEPVEVAHE